MSNKKRSSRIPVCLIFLSLLCIPVPSLFPQFLFLGQVIKVSDGDTLTVRSGEVNFRVRLHGIDAPEKGQPFSIKSRELLASMVTESPVAVKVMDVDRYGRLIALVYSGNLLVNLEMLLQGLAWHYADYDDTPRFIEAEAEAKKDKRGLWAEPDPVPPWEWRKR